MGGSAARFRQVHFSQQPSKTAHSFRSRNQLSTETYRVAFHDRARKVLRAGAAGLDRPSVLHTSKGERNLAMVSCAGGAMSVELTGRHHIG